jgi:hypothetical protein
VYDGSAVADVQAIISQAGPLPIKTTAEIMSDGPAVLTLAGSVWTPTANRMIGFTLLVDGEPTNISAEIFSNGPSTHRAAVVPVVVPYTFTIGPHTFALEPATSDTTSDSNDRFYLTVQY